MPGSISRRLKEMSDWDEDDLERFNGRLLRVIESWERRRRRNIGAVRVERYLGLTRLITDHAPSIRRDLQIYPESGWSARKIVPIGVAATLARLASLRPRCGRRAAIRRKFACPQE